MASLRTRQEDLQKLKTRELWIQHADGSYAPVGTVLYLNTQGAVATDANVLVPRPGDLVVPAHLYAADICAGHIHVTGNVDISGQVTADNGSFNTVDVSENITSNSGEFVQLYVGDEPVYPVPTNDIRYFTTPNLSFPLTNNSAPLVWPVGYWPDSSGNINGVWICSIVGCNYNISNVTITPPQAFSSYCRIENGGWHLYASFANPQGISANFDIMCMPAQLTDDRRAAPAKTFDVFQKALENGGITPYVGYLAGRRYLRVLFLSRNAWPSDLTNVSQIISLTVTVYAELQDNGINRPNDIVDAKFRMITTGTEQTNLFYAYQKRITFKEGQIPNGGGASYHSSEPNMVAIGTPGTPGTGINGSTIINNQTKLLEVFGVGFTSDTIDKTRDITGFWYIGYPRYYLTNCECTEFKILYNPR